VIEQPRTIVHPLPSRPADCEGIGLFLRDRLLIVSLPQRLMTEHRQ